MKSAVFHLCENQYFWIISDQTSLKSLSQSRIVRTRTYLHLNHRIAQTALHWSHETRPCCMSYATFEEDNHLGTQKGIAHRNGVLWKTCQLV